MILIKSLLCFQTDFRDLISKKKEVEKALSGDEGFELSLYQRYDIFDQVKNSKTCRIRFGIEVLGSLSHAINQSTDLFKLSNFFDE